MFPQFPGFFNRLLHWGSEPPKKETPSSDETSSTGESLKGVNAPDRIKTAAESPATPTPLSSEADKRSLSPVTPSSTEEGSTVAKIADISQVVVTPAPTQTSDVQKVEPTPKKAAPIVLRGALGESGTARNTFEMVRTALQTVLGEKVSINWEKQTAGAAADVTGNAPISLFVYRNSAGPFRLDWSHLTQEADKHFSQFDKNSPSVDYHLIVIIREYNQSPHQYPQPGSYDNEFAAWSALKRDKVSRVITLTAVRGNDSLIDGEIMNKTIRDGNIKVLLSVAEDIKKIAGQRGSSPALDMAPVKAQEPISTPAMQKNTSLATTAGAARDDFATSYTALTKSQGPSSSEPSPYTYTPSMPIQTTQEKPTPKPSPSSTSPTLSTSLSTSSALSLTPSSAAPSSVTPKATVPTTAVSSVSNSNQLTVIPGKVKKDGSISQQTLDEIIGELNVFAKKEKVQLKCEDVTTSAVATGKSVDGVSLIFIRSSSIRPPWGSTILEMDKLFTSSNQSQPTHNFVVFVTFETERAWQIAAPDGDYRLLYDAAMKKYNFKSVQFVVDSTGKKLSREEMGYNNFEKINTNAFKRLASLIAESNKPQKDDKKE